MSPPEKYPYTVESNRKRVTVRSSLVWLGLTAVGYLANAVPVPLFFNVDFLFGSVFALIVLHYFGWGPATVPMM